MTFTKRNLPHLYFEFGIYFVTFRLAGSLPMSVEAELRKSKKKFKDYDALLDSGMSGPDYLKYDNIADIIKECLHYPDNTEYKLICYCIMSNHVHVMFEFLENNKGLDKIMQSIIRYLCKKSQ